MEESEQRRERLKIMRMEAAQVGSNADSSSSGLAPSGLSNPLIESETPVQCTSSRFDYYTDPVAAFTGNRRRNNVSPQVSQGHCNIPPRAVYQGMTPPPPPPVYQNTAVSYPNQRMFQEPPQVYQNRPVNYPDQRTFQVPRPHFSQGPRAHFSQNPGVNFNQNPIGIPARPLGRPQGNHPNAWGGSRGDINYNSTPPNYSRGGNNFTRPGFRQEGSHVNYGRGRGQGFNSRPHYDSGRGRGWRGAGSSHSAVSAELRPDLYYKKEMVEDPWRMLSPVVWKGSHAFKSDQSWFPKSIGVKKAKVSTEAAQTSIPQKSLAEYLAASFNDSTSEAVDDKTSS